MHEDLMSKNLNNELRFLKADEVCSLLTEFMKIKSQILYTSNTTILQLKEEIKNQNTLSQNEKETVEQEHTKKANTLIAELKKTSAEEMVSFASQ